MIIFVTGAYNQLGNQLYVLAALVAEVEEYGGYVVHPFFGSYCRFFFHSKTDNCFVYSADGSRPWISRLPAPQLRGLIRAGYGLSKLWRRIVRLPSRVRLLTSYSSEWLRLNDEPHDQHTWIQFVRGYYVRNTDLVRKHADRLRETFRVEPSLVNAVRTKLAELRVEADVLIGVHVRRGDYANWRGGEFLLEAETYAAAIRSLIEQLRPRRVKVIVCSNESINSSDFHGIEIYRLGSSVAEDLFTLSQCDYILGPPSTFSGWAAFMGKCGLLYLRQGVNVVDIATIRVPEVPPDFHKSAGESLHQDLGV